MPVLASSRKALRRDQRRQAINRRIKNQLKIKTDLFLKKDAGADLAKTYRIIDRAAKKHVIHPNKANRLKSQYARLSLTLTPKPPKPAKPAKVVTRRTSKK